MRLRYNMMRQHYNSDLLTERSKRKLRDAIASMEIYEVMNCYSISLLWVLGVYDGNPEDGIPPIKHGPGFLVAYSEREEHDILIEWDRGQFIGVSLNGHALNFDNIIIDFNGYIFKVCEI